MTLNDTWISLDADRAALGRWLGERAVEHDAPALMALAGEHLRARRVLRPPVDALSRMIASARAEAHREVERLLAGQLPAARRDVLDALRDGEGPGPRARGCRRSGPPSGRASATTAAPPTESPAATPSAAVARSP